MAHVGDWTHPHWLMDSHTCSSRLQHMAASNKLLTEMRAQNKAFWDKIGKIGPAPVY